MCGICGKFDKTGVNQPDLAQMTSAIAHRGPDDEGFYLDKSIGMGVRRLSIIDLQAGNQPVSNEDGTIWIVFNGEIYNFRQLRGRLQDNGHSFSSHTDTEVIVHLYEDYGFECLQFLRGMFAFAIWDSRRQVLFIARDRLGQKPMFYSDYGGVFQFGSEVKSLLATGDVPREIDYRSIYDYLSLRFIPSPGTMFRHIRKLPPAHYLTYRDGSVRVSRYWDLEFEEEESLAGKDFIEGVESKLSETVSTHLVSDVPIGAFLSGGLDSSMIVAMMARTMEQGLDTFAIGVDNEDFSELPFARQVADHVGTRHHESCVKSNLVQLLPEMIWHMDEPSDPIAACVYYGAELAGRHVKVVLGGDGGDELFAGYDRYLGLHYLGFYNVIPNLIRQKVIGPIISSIPENFSYKSWTQQLRWFHEVASAGGRGAQYAAATSFFRFSDAEKRMLFRDRVSNGFGNHNSDQIIADIFDQASAVTLTDRMLYTDIVTRLPEHTLMLTDRMTMAHGVEARSPFMDHELVEYLARVPSQMKIRNGELKSILRQVAENYLPDAIVRRPKQGFMFPVAYWFREDLYPYLRDSLLSSTFIEEGIFSRSYVEKLIEEHRSSQVDHHVRLWMLLNLDIWHQIYLEGRSPASISGSIKESLGQSSRTSSHRP